ncbi:hypothetical protein LWM68_17490 [Niabella sp. W65]|nr:hypothetical protein [Niabella sp. W65]MCH7364382.1 hypothetical protein [Niabella sp. W65]ULT40254.1 hypothetical protein KRR40_36400 [Niabella sp. I65]
MQGGLRGVQVYERSGTHLNDISAAYNWSALRGKNVKKVFPDSENNIWIGTSAGLYLIKAGKKVVTAANKFIGQNDTAALYITCIQEDRQGNMWFGVEDGGFKNMTADRSSCILLPSVNKQKEIIYTAYWKITMVLFG